MKIPFLGLPDHPQAKVALIPAPLELTTSWKKGTSLAPLEILKVSPNLEFFDEETKLEPYLFPGFYTFPIPELSYNLEMALKEISEMITQSLNLQRFPLIIGGEHTLSLAAIRTLKKFYPYFRVLYLDAHPDLRDSYLGSKINHATVIRRIYEMGIPVLGIGIRTCSKEEWEFIIGENISLIGAQEFKEDIKTALSKIKEFIKESPFYLSLDMDVFDPSLAPGVGTPEPGGLTWEEFLKILRELTSPFLIGMDIVETLPLPCHQITEYLVCKIIMKVSAYLARSYESLA
ncbi:MAG: agmatinase [Thermodesulfobacteriaceae bacterium]|nr:agmatinase [Caldimicrobium sp.]MCX8041576.1 agmatinase [Thermodesulfobacteriaceae bacterium]MDW8136083.1 agmatinase [Thermodesulfobacterium sp.]